MTISEHRKLCIHRNTLEVLPIIDELDATHLIGILHQEPKLTMQLANSVLGTRLEQGLRLYGYIV